MRNKSFKKVLAGLVMGVVLSTSAGVGLAQSVKADTTVPVVQAEVPTVKANGIIVMSSNLYLNNIRQGISSLDRMAKYNEGDSALELFFNAYNNETNLVGDTHYSISFLKIKDVQITIEDLRTAFLNKVRVLAANPSTKANLVFFKSFIKPAYIAKFNAKTTQLMSDVNAILEATN